MKVVNQSLVPVKHPYFHLAYLAATVSLPDPQKGFLTAGIFFLVLGSVILRDIVFPKILQGLTIAGTIFGIYLFFALAGDGQWAEWLGKLKPVAWGGSVVLIVGGVLLIRKWDAEAKARVPGKKSGEEKGDLLNLKPFFSQDPKGVFCLVLGALIFVASFLAGETPLRRPVAYTKHNMYWLASKMEEFFFSRMDVKKEKEEPGMGLSDSLKELNLSEDQKELLLDAWQTPFQVRINDPEGNDFSIRSAGKDKTFATDDDVILTVHSGNKTITAKAETDI